MGANDKIPFYNPGLTKKLAKTGEFSEARGNQRQWRTLLYWTPRQAAGAPKGTFKAGSN